MARMTRVFSDPERLGKIHAGLACVADRLCAERIAEISPQTAAKAWSELAYWLRATGQLAEQIDHPDYRSVVTLVLAVEGVLSSADQPSDPEQLRNVLYDVDRRYGGQIRRLLSSLWRWPDIPEGIDADEIEWPDLIALPEALTGAECAHAFVPSALQREILELLRGAAMTADELEHRLECARGTLFGRDRKGGLTELKKKGLIKNDRRVGGYYRPDAPPSVVD